MDDSTHGTARFATKQDGKPLVDTPSGLLIGRDTASNRLLRYDGPAHLLTMAPTRTGKGVGTLIPNLLTADRSVICIDPKGENARITARARACFGQVHILDPFAVTGERSAAFNPLADLAPESVDAAEEAAALADALVYDPPGEAGEAHWNEEAKALIGGLILFIAATELADRRNLATLREALTLAPDAFAALLARMQQSSATDFGFADLKRRTATVFLVLPPDRLAPYARWLRLVLTRSLADMARSADKPAAPCSTSSTSSPPWAASIRGRSVRAGGRCCSWPTIVARCAAS